MSWQPIPQGRNERRIDSSAFPDLASGQQTRRDRRDMRDRRAVPSSSQDSRGQRSSGPGAAWQARRTDGSGGGGGGGAPGRWNDRGDRGGRYNRDRDRDRDDRRSRGRGDDRFGGRRGDDNFGSRGRDRDRNDRGRGGFRREPSPPPPPEAFEQGIVASIPKDFGFIRCTTRTDDIFFHLSELSQEDTAAVEPGSEVEFVVVESRGRPRARLVRLLPDDTVSFVQVLPEVRRGVVVTAPEVSRDMTEEKRRGGHARPVNPERLGLVKVTSEPTQDDGGRFPPCPADSLLQCGLQDVAGKGRARARLCGGDVITFKQSVQTRTGLLFATDIRVEESALDIVARTSTEPRVRGVVTAVSKGTATAELLDRDAPVTFSLSQVKARAAATDDDAISAAASKVEEGDEASSSRVGVEVGDSVAMLVVPEPSYTGEDAEMWLGERAHAERPLVGASVVVLPRGSVRVETVVAEAVTATVTAPLLWVPNVGGGGGRGNNAPRTADPGTLRVPVASNEMRETGRLSNDAEAVDVTFDHTSVASRHPDLKIGDTVTCELVFNERSQSFVVRNVALAVPRTAARETGVIANVVKHFAFVRCSQREGDLRFHQNAYLARVDPAFADRTGLPPCPTTPTPGMHVSFDVEVDARSGGVIANRVMFMPPGSVSNFVEVQRGAEGVVRSIVGAGGGRNGGRNGGGGGGGFFDRANKGGAASGGGAAGSNMRDTMAVITVTPSPEAFAIMSPAYRLREELLWALRDLALDIYRAELAFRPFLRMSPRDRNWLTRTAAAMGFQTTIDTPKDDGAAATGGDAAGANASAGGRRRRVGRAGPPTGPTITVWKTATFHDVPRSFAVDAPVDASGMDESAAGAAAAAAAAGSEDAPAAAAASEGESGAAGAGAGAGAGASSGSGSGSGSGARSRTPKPREVRVPFSQLADPRAPQPRVGDKVTLTLLWSRRARQLRGSDLAVVAAPRQVGVVDMFRSRDQYGFLRVPGRDANLFFHVSEFQAGLNGAPAPRSVAVGTGVEFSVRRDPRGRDVATHLVVIPASRVKFEEVWRRGTVTAAASRRRGGGGRKNDYSRTVDVEIQPQATPATGDAAAAPTPRRVQVVPSCIAPSPTLNRRPTLVPGDVVEYTTMKRGNGPNAREVTTAVRLLQAAPRRCRGVVTKMTGKLGYLRPLPEAAAAASEEASSSAAAGDAAPPTTAAAGGAPLKPVSTRSRAQQLTFRPNAIVESVDACCVPAHDADDTAAEATEAEAAAAAPTATADAPDESASREDRFADVRRTTLKLSQGDLVEYSLTSFDKFAVRVVLVQRGYEPPAPSGGAGGAGAGSRSAAPTRPRISVNKKLKQALAEMSVVKSTMARGPDGSIGFAARGRGRGRAMPPPQPPAPSQQQQAAPAVPSGVQIVAVEAPALAAAGQQE